jgi:ATP-dependent DNA helicase RecG
MVEIFDNRIDISSPGGLVPGLTEKEFGTKSVLRNPNIAALFHRIEYIEQMGTGINRMQGQVKEYGLKPISFTFTTFVTATFERGAETIEKSEEVRDKFGINSVEIRNKFGKNALNVLESIKANNSIKSNQIAEMLSLTQRTVEKKIAELKNAGILKRVGSKKTGYWEIADPEAVQ